MKKHYNFDEKDLNFKSKASERGKPKEQKILLKFPKTKQFKNAFKIEEIKLPNLKSQIFSIDLSPDKEIVFSMLGGYIAKIIKQDGRFLKQVIYKGKKIPL